MSMITQNGRLTWVQHYICWVLIGFYCHQSITYRSNLLPFHDHTIILCYKTILPQYLPWNDSKLPLWKVSQHCPMVANSHTTVIYCSISTLENVGTAENYISIFITLAPDYTEYRNAHLCNIIIAIFLKSLLLMTATICNAFLPVWTSLNGREPKRC